MSSVPKKKKVTVKSDIWFVDWNVIKSVGLQESPLFGTESTQFYLRAEKRGSSSFYALYLYLADCKEEKIHVNVKLVFGLHNRPTSKYLLNGEISLDKSKKIGWDKWAPDSVYTLTEITFEEIDVPTPKVTQQKDYEALSSQLAILRENNEALSSQLLTLRQSNEELSGQLVTVCQSNEALSSQLLNLQQKF